MLICETQRLVIRTLDQGDVAQLSEILSDPEVMKHSLRGVCDERATREFIDWCLGSYAAHGVGPWALVDKQDAALVGFCGVGPEMVEGVEEANLGYRLARRYWGKGLASEAARAVLAYALSHKQLDSVIVLIEPDHVASLRVAEKAGFSEYKTIEFHGRPVRMYRASQALWSATQTQE